MENKIKHLEFIQKIIDRLSGNSFLIKRWTIVLFAAMASFSIKESNSTYALIALFPIFIFWILDSFYLMQERLFRDLYNTVRVIKKDKEIDFAMNTGKQGFEKFCVFLSSFLSITKILFYGTLLILITIFYYFKFI